MPEKQLTFLQIQDQIEIAKIALDKAEAIQNDLLQEYLNNPKMDKTFLSFYRPHYGAYGEIAFDYIQKAISTLTSAIDLIEQNHKEKRKGFVQ